MPLILAVFSIARTECAGRSINTIVRDEQAADRAFAARRDHLRFAFAAGSWKHDRERLCDDMARCDEGYLCEVCGREVKGITDSDLYLRYVIGEVDAQELLAAPERHLRCNPFLAQFIVDPSFPPMVHEGAFAKTNLDPADVSAKEALVTRGWRRLREVHKLGLPISEYPLMNGEQGTGNR